MNLKVAGVFSDNMVLQCGMKVPVWGWAQPGGRVEVKCGGQTKTSAADAAGRWEVALDAMTASSVPQSLQVDAGSSKCCFSNVLVGEVWICSGQSNMQFTVGAGRDAEREVSEADYPDMRLLTVPRVTLDKPQNDLTGASWKVCAPAAVKDFSGVGYFFGRELHRRLKVPIGLIDSSWGGTVAEAWTSFSGLSAVPALKDLVELVAPEKTAERLALYQARAQELQRLTRDTCNSGVEKGWAGVAEPVGDWQDMDLPRTWQSFGLNFSGVFWFRKSLELPPAWVGRELKLEIGACDKSDSTYFNNVKVGGISMADRPDAYSVPRVYPVPASLAKAGRCVIAVRVHSDRFVGGMTGRDDKMKLSCPSLPDAAPIPLAGMWRYAVEQNYGLVQYPAAPLGAGDKNTPCGLFNAMIAPLIPYAVRGAIWYQGESNAQRATQYRTLFPTMISDWRRHWHREAAPQSGPPFPFLFVQLANFRHVQPVPSEGGWAELREAQTLALKLPDTGMAVAIDVGEANDIHPKNKQDVGLRLALSALTNAYHVAGIVSSGPLFREARSEGGGMRIHFRHTDGGLVAHGPELKGFAMAGADRVFVWAKARIEGDSIVVESPGVPRPESVRYAWADNPIGNLYNGAGLPASPFRTDTWA